MEKSIHSREFAQLRGLLRQLRLKAGLKQADLARKLRKPQSFVSNYERGERHLDLLELRQVCNALGVGMVDFVKRFEHRGGEK